MELAKKHDIYVILTSWEYQNSSWFVADPAIRKEVFAVPPDARFMHLARQFDRLLCLLKGKGLHRNIAFVEIHNEPDASEFPAGDCIFQSVSCRAETSRCLHEEAIRFLRARHSDVLISADLTAHNYAMPPDNAQVFDEGGLFYPPRLSRFELSPKGLAVLELMTDLAIHYDYWGFMPGTYCGPEHLIWDENPGWQRLTNERFQRGKLVNQQVQATLASTPDPIRWERGRKMTERREFCV